MIRSHDVAATDGSGASARGAKPSSERSVARLKGPGRPVQSEAGRAAILGSLASVDLVAIFNEDVPMRLIERLKPAVVIKGADWAGKTAPDFEYVRSYGGRMEFAKLTPGQNTTRRSGGWGLDHRGHLLASLS